MDIADARCAWMIRHLNSKRQGKMAGLGKSFTWGIEDGLNRTTRGETVEIYSMVTLSIEDLHVSGVVPKSMRC